MGTCECFHPSTRFLGQRRCSRVATRILRRGSGVNMVVKRACGKHSRELRIYWAQTPWVPVSVEVIQ